MLNATNIVIAAFVEQIRMNNMYIESDIRSELRTKLEFVARRTLENLYNSNAPHHDMEHTMMVTEVGQQVLRGKHV
jgi:hypothetical protein